MENCTICGCFFKLHSNHMDTITKNMVDKDINKTRIKCFLPNLICVPRSQQQCNSFTHLDNSPVLGGPSILYFLWMGWGGGGCSSVIHHDGYRDSQINMMGHILWVCGCWRGGGGWAVTVFSMEGNVRYLGAYAQILARRRAMYKIKLVYIISLVATILSICYCIYHFFLNFYISWHFVNCISDLYMLLTATIPSIC